MGADLSGSAPAAVNVEPVRDGFARDAAQGEAYAPLSLPDLFFASVAQETEAAAWLEARRAEGVSDS